MLVVGEKQEGIALRSSATTFPGFPRIVELCHETSLLGAEEGEQRLPRTPVLTSFPSDKITS